MPNHVIQRIHELAENEGRAEDLDEDGCPIFEWELGTPVSNIITEGDAREPIDI